MVTRYIRYFILVLVGLGLLLMAMANRATVPLKFLPDDLAAFTGMTWAVELPLYLVIFGGLLAGLVLGFVWEWLRERQHRKAARVKTREVSRLERELATMKDATSVPQDDVLALLNSPKSR